MYNSRIVGAQKEQKALEYLQRNHYVILDTNYTRKQGEIDIVARDTADDYLVFVEVKYRTNDRFGMPYQAVDGRKQRQLSNMAVRYLNEKGLQSDIPVRFDIISIYRDKLEHIKNAFAYCGTYHI